jgi:hypothetical protein
MQGVARTAWRGQPLNSSPSLDVKKRSIHKGIATRCAILEPLRYRNRQFLTYKDYVVYRDGSASRRIRRD